MGILRRFLVEIDVDADFAELAAFDNRLKEFDKRLTLVSFAARSMALQVAGMSAALAGSEVVMAGVAGAGTVLTGVVANMTTQTRRQARASNVSAQNLQKLRLGLQTYQIKAEKAIDVTSSLASTQQEALNGQKSSVRALEKLGIGLDSIRGLSPWQMFHRVARAVRNSKNEQKALTAAQDIFGESLGSAIMPMLQQGSAGITEMGDRFERFNAILSDETLEDFQELTKSGMDLWVILRGMARFMAAKLLPFVQGAADSIKEWVDNNEELIQQRLTYVARRIAGAMMLTAKNARDVAASIREMGGVSGILKDIRDIIGTIAVAALVGYFISLTGTVISAGNAVALTTVKFLALAASEGVAAAASTTLTAAVGTLEVSLAPLLGGILAVVAGIAALVVVFEDVWTWIRGGSPSLTGAFAAWLDKLVSTKMLWAGLQRLGSSLVDLFASMGLTAENLGIMLNFLWKATKLLTGILIKVTIGAFHILAGALTSVVKLVESLVWVFRALMVALSGGNPIDEMKKSLDAVNESGQSALNTFEELGSLANDDGLGFDMGGGGGPGSGRGGGQGMPTPTQGRGMTPPSSSQGGGGQTVVDNSKREYNIHQSPGQSPKSVAQEIDRKEKDQARRIKEKSSLGEDR